MSNKPFFNYTANSSSSESRGLRIARYTDVRSRILKFIEEKQEITLQDLGNEGVRMETIISDTNMIQNKKEEYGYIRKI